MSLTNPTYFGYVNSVFSNTIEAYYGQKNTLSALAFEHLDLTLQPGVSQVFPFYSRMNRGVIKGQRDVEPPSSVISNSSFSYTVDNWQLDIDFSDFDFANVFTRELMMGSGSWNPETDPMDDLFEEAARQAANEYSLNDEQQLINLVSTSGNFNQVYTSTVSTDTMTSDIILTSRRAGAGSKANLFKVAIMHPMQLNDWQKSVPNLFSASAIRQDVFATAEWQGQVLGMDIYTNDYLPSTTIDGQTAYTMFLFRENPFGIGYKQKPMAEFGRDIKKRNTLMATTGWWGYVSLHQQISSYDARVLAITTPVSRDINSGVVQPLSPNSGSAVAPIPTVISGTNGTSATVHATKKIGEKPGTFIVPEGV